MLADALDWWVARMTELVPQRWRNPRLGNVIVIDADRPGAATATILLHRNGHEEPLGTFVAGSTDAGRLRAIVNGSMKRCPVLLRPPPGVLLEKALVLPSAAGRDLHRVVGYEMNRVTPFNADDVFWTCVVEKQDRTHKRMHVRLSLVPKSAVRPLFGAIEAAGLRIEALDAVSSAGTSTLVPVSRDAGARPLATRYLAIACGVLAILAVAAPFVRQSFALAAVEQRIAQLRPDVARVQAMRKRMAAASAGRDAITEVRLKVGDPLQVLAAVTELLPDDTYLTELSLRERRLTLGGQSAGAAKLIATLASDPLFRDPGFAAPVTRNDTIKRDVFSIHADVVP